MANDSSNGSGGGNGSPILTDGSTSFAGGVDSLKVTTMASSINPNGLRRDQLSWLINGTVRDAGISPRWGNQPICKVGNPDVLYQGGLMYDQKFGNPYLLLALSGKLWKVDPDAKTVQNLSAQFPGMTLPAAIDQAHFVQAEEFVIVQAGDNVTLPLIWDNARLRRSRGLSTTADNSVTTTNRYFDVTVNGDQVAIAPWVNHVITLVPPSNYGGAVGDIVLWASQTGTVQIGYFQITAIGVNQFTIIPYAPSTGNTNLGIGGGAGGVWRLFVQNGSPTAATTNVVWPEIPAGGPMDYYEGRIWFARDRNYSAGDILGGEAGTRAYNFRDSILRITENPLILDGDGFTVPDQAGNIRAIKHSANINVALGQGQLFIFTRKAVYALDVPVTRDDWTNATSKNQPLQTVVQLVNGATGDRCVVPVNGDLYYQSFEPGIRSLVAAVRYFQQPGNIEISANENRLIQFNDRELLRFGSGIEFDNRLLETALPFLTPQGVAHKALVPLDFVPVSSFNETYSPVWEGHWEGIDVMQLFTGDFGGRQRAFAVVLMRKTSELWLWELTRGDKFENGDNRVTMQIEFPAFSWNGITELKKLVGGELWIDRLTGTVEFTLEYRVDGENCWIPWMKWKECSARDSDEYNAPRLTPYPQPCGTGYRQTIDFPAPPTSCSQMQRPTNIGYQFQPRLTVHGYCRVRGIFLHATKWLKKLYEKLPCSV